MAGPLLNSDGSAEWKTEPPVEISFACSVNGPLEAKARDELPQEASLELVYRGNEGMPMIRERLIQDRIHTCLLAAVRRDLLPRSLIQIVVQLLDSSLEKPLNGAKDKRSALEISEGVNVMSVALADAGIPLRGIVAAVSYAVDHEGRPSLLSKEVGPADPMSLHSIAFRFIGEDAPQIVMVESVGQFREEELTRVVDEAQRDAAAVEQIIRARIERQVRP